MKVVSMHKQLLSVSAAQCNGCVAAAAAIQCTTAEVESDDSDENWFECVSGGGGRPAETCVLL